ncbi:thermonuclease family protein [Mycoplana rhizolycopersici]|uniref:Thermonuclease family protein n=1 Tax=Mycoplana rhizolycopersici TaxID=2746702 RepID=A0ABX2QAR2_9HYPH|nr:thermonuclease family protein [Rhizobium rhizolycopersici]NVP54034.1 thermonuclease family protein [Rhizobium rhizolycopersici]
MKRFGAYIQVIACLIVAIATPGRARDAHFVAGPVTADLLRVVDGDTLLVSARPWPQQSIEVLVRLRGIDAPELRAKCPAARGSAHAARLLLGRLVGVGAPVILTNIAGDKYFGRVVADVRLSDDVNPAHELVAAGLAIPYDGAARRPCEASYSQ